MVSFGLVLFLCRVSACNQAAAEQKADDYLYDGIFFGMYGLAVPFVPKDYVHAFVYINPLFRFADFYIGALLYKLYSAKKAELENKNLLGLIFQILALTATCLAVYAYRFVPDRIRFQALFFIPSAMTVLSFAVFDRTVFSKALGVKAFRRLGEISFTFYLLHALGMSFVNIVISHVGLEINFVYKSLLQFAFVLAGSMIVYRLYEKPVAKKLMLKQAKKCLDAKAGKKKKG